MNFVQLRGCAQERTKYFPPPFPPYLPQTLLSTTDSAPTMNEVKNPSLRKIIQLNPNQEAIGGAGLSYCGHKSQLVTVSRPLDLGR